MAARAALLALLHDKAVIARLADLGSDPVGGDGKDLERRVDTFAGIARERNIATSD